MPSESRVPERLQTKLASSRVSQAPRQAYFGRDHGWLETPVIMRSDIGTGRAGPLIVEEYDATCVIPPQATVNLDDYGNMLIELSANQ